MSDDFGFKGFGMKGEGGFEGIEIEEDRRFGWVLGDVGEADLV